MELDYRGSEGGPREGGCFRQEDRGGLSEGCKIGDGMAAAKA